MKFFFAKNHACCIVCFSLHNNEAPTAVATNEKPDMGEEPDMGDQPVNGECTSFLTLCEYGDIVLLLLINREL